MLSAFVLVVWLDLPQRLAKVGVEVDGHVASIRTACSYAIREGRSLRTLLCSKNHVSRNGRVGRRLYSRTRASQFPGPSVGVQKSSA